MSSWKECKLGDVADVRDGTHDSPKETIDGKYLITSKHIKNGKIDFSKAYKISLNDFESVNKRSKVDKYDILFSMIGTIGEMVIVDFEPDFAIKNVGLFKTKNKDLSKWIYYYLKSNDAQAEIHASLKGSTQQYITLGDLRNFPIQIPPLEEQKAIVEVLSSLDDKIDLLHRQNQTLESLAQTLFRQWFIEEVKEEWEEKPLSEIVLHVKNNIKPASLENKLFFHFSLPAFDNGQRPTKELGNEILSNKYQVIKNSILVSKLNPRTPRIWLIDENIDEDSSICSTEFQVLYPKEEIWRGFIYCFLKTEQAVQELAGASSGTSGSHQRVKPEDIFNLTFQYPDMNILKKFDEQSSNYWRKIKVNQKQIQTLENLRDTLLPKLLSGEVRVEI